VNVRPARLEDVPEIARVHAASAEAAYGIDDDVGRRADNWRGVFDTPAISPFVAEADGEIVGILSVGPARDESDDGELYVIYVLPDWWGSRAGQLLLDKAHEVLAQRFGEAVLTVLAANPRARRFYERNSWVLERTAVEPHFGGRPTEVALYRKVLKR
jgi:ribosomal protein S18 acetylase RimI-like enzyme